MRFFMTLICLFKNSVPSSSNAFVTASGLLNSTYAKLQEADARDTAVRKRRPMDTGSKPKLRSPFGLPEFISDDGATVYRAARAKKVREVVCFGIEVNLQMGEDGQSAGCSRRRSR